MIYVDFTECIPQGTITFHGGANYGIRMSKVLAKHYDVTILIPDEAAITELCKCEFMEFSRIKILSINDLQTFALGTKKDVLFIPLISTRRIPSISKVKKNNVGMKIFVTIHGIRKQDLPPDYVDSLYQDKSRVMRF